MKLTLSIILFFLLTCSLTSQSVNQKELIDTLSAEIKVYTLEDITVIDYKIPVVTCDYSNSHMVTIESYNRQQQQKINKLNYSSNMFKYPTLRAKVQ